MGRTTSQLFDLQPDPYDSATPSRNLRVCLFTDVSNAPELRAAVRDGQIDAAMIRAELVMEPFTLLAAANRAVHYAGHNRMATRSLHAELIYSLSPSKNITDSLVTFGIAEDSANLVVAVFDDPKGDKLAAVAKKIKGRAVALDQLKNFTNYDLVKKVYHVKEPELNKASITDAILSRIVTKDYVA